VVGGALVAATSPDVAYVVNAVSFAVSAVLILRIRERFEEADRAPSRGGWRDITEGLSLAVRSRALLTVLVAWSIVMLANAGVNVSEFFLATKVFKGGDFGYGLLVGATGLGLVAGSLFGGSWVSQRGLAIPYAVSIGLMALGFGAAAVAPNVWIAALVVIAAGAGNGVAVITNALLVQRGAPDRLRGRAFTVVMSVGYAVLGLGMVVAGPLTNAIGARAVWGISAGLTALGALVGLVLVRGVTPETRPGDALPASE
jgi:MFS family permease